MQQSVLVSLVPLFPLIGAVIVGLLSLAGSRSESGPPKWLVALIAVAMPAISTVFALQLAFGLADNPEGYVHTLYTWFQVGALSIPVEFYADRLSGVMILVVTFIGTLIHLYSVAYMWEDRGFARFMAYLNLFTFSMLVLVLGKNLPLMFLGWEGVGACSYLLIGFWFKDTEKAQAANKAFIVNRIGDLGFLIGMFVLFYYMGTRGVYSLDFTVLRDNAALFTPVMATVIGLLLFVGAAGKSAQIPLHVWLADAMAGPTPVSALIHAATMVTAGVYLVARMSFMYVQAPVAGGIIAAIGLATAVMAATIAITQTNIKKVLAYSTLSQLGYMFVAVGLGAYATGVFHLMTHAFFKALLFLGAGSVIHAMHHHEDMAHYGGLKKVIPFTYAIMLVGCLAIAGIWPFAGFFSKDAILLAAFEGGQYWIYAIALFTGGLTAFYMFRMLFLTFHGKPRDPEAYHHAHEGPWTMWLPLLVLAIGSTVVGFLGNPIVWGGSAFAAWLEPSLPHVAHHAVSASLEYTLMALAVIVGSLGILIAYLMYGPHRKPALAPSGNPLWQLFSHLYFFDALYRNLIVRPLLALSRAGLYRVIDRQAIDGTVNGLPRIYTGVASAVRYLQTGVVRQYALAMLLGLVAILLIVVTRFSVFRF